MDLGKKFVDVRKSKKMTQAIAARQIGIQQSYLSKIETGRHLPSEEIISKICDVYGIEVNEVVDSMSSNRQQGKRKNMHVLVFLRGLVATGVLLLILGGFSLIYPQIFYTYKVIAKDKSESAGYHLSNSYLGEIY